MVDRDELIELDREIDLAERELQRLRKAAAAASGQAGGAAGSDDAVSTRERHLDQLYLKRTALLRRGPWRRWA